MKGVTFSLLSGFLASTASVFGKLSMASEHALSFCEALLMNIPILDDKKENAFAYPPMCPNILLFLRLGFFISMLLTNSLMWTVFTKALRHSSTTLEATVTNTAANFFFTAVYGQVIFGELLTFLWWSGTILILTGFLLIHYAEERPAQNTIKKIN